MYLLRRLPWIPDSSKTFKNAEEKKHHVIDIKTEMTTDEIFIGFPSVFRKIGDYLYTLKFGDTIDYDLIKSLIAKSLYDNFKTTKIGDWRPF